MDLFKLDKMTRGWFIGDFEPSLLKADYEVAVKKYKAGDSEDTHYHAIATEFTVIISGIVIMNNAPYGPGDILKIYPGEETDFYCVQDCVTVVVKTKSVKGDKYTV
jgi:hypothetical protein